MLDIKLIRKDAQAIEKKLRTKEPDVDLSPLLELDEQIRNLKTRGEEIKAQRNNFSKQIGELKRKGDSADELMEQVQGLSSESHEIDQQLQQLEAEFKDQLARLPNLPMDDIKVAADPAENVCIKTWGEKPTFDFTHKNHLELNEELQVFDFVRGAKLAGTGWPLYRDMGARLEWALLNYMLDIQIKNGFTFFLPPLCARPEVLFGAGQLPKFADQQFKITDDDYRLYLIPTAEVPLTGMHADEIIEAEQLPLKYTAYTPCFRREAGAAGKNERGMIRVHQFNKVEMYAYCKPDESSAMFEQMLKSAEEVLEGLGMHYRNMLLVTGDMSFGSARTVDIEVWLPGQDRYYEVSSVSNCTDYQARRSKIRYREKGGKPELLHTLNGSGLATARLMVALLENNQDADGSVRIPEVLQKYLGGIDRLTPAPSHART